MDLSRALPAHLDRAYRYFHHESKRLVRYAEGPSAEVEVLIDAPIRRVWDLVVDINLPARFSDEFQGAAWLDGKVRVGARFSGRNAHPALGEWQTTSWVQRFDPPRAFGWAVSDPDNPSASWWFTLEELGPQVVRLRHGGRMGPAPSGLSVAISAMPEKEERIIARRLEEWTRNMQATVDGIKQIAQEQA